jgi:hypothetical protein
VTTPGEPLRKAADAHDALATQVAKLHRRLTSAEHQIDGHTEYADLTVNALHRIADRLGIDRDELFSPVDDAPAPTPEPPDVTTPPDVPGKLPVRVARGPIEHQSASNFVIDRPLKGSKSTAGVWLDKFPRPDEPVVYTLTNGIVHNYGPTLGKRWDHAIYANNADLTLDDIWLYGPTHREQLGRSHPIYLNGSSLTATRLMIGSPDDEHPHTISINIDKGDGVEHKPRPVTIDTLLVYGGWRNVIENTPGTVSKLTIGKMIVVDPVTAGGLWEGIEVDGCEVAIGDYIVIDTGGRWKSGAMLKAKNCTGEVKRARVATANSALEMGDLIRGVGYTLAGHAIPRTPNPAWNLDNFDKLVEHYGGAG